MIIRGNTASLHLFIRFPLYYLFPWNVCWNCVCALQFLLVSAHGLSDPSIDIVMRILGGCTIYTILSTVYTCVSASSTNLEYLLNFSSSLYLVTPALGSLHWSASAHWRAVPVHFKQCSRMVTIDHTKNVTQKPTKYLNIWRQQLTILWSSGKWKW